MKFKFYITDTMNGMVQGTDDDVMAKEAAESEECFVVNSETGMWLLSSGEEEEIRLV